MMRLRCLVLALLIALPGLATLSTARPALADDVKTVTAALEKGDAISAASIAAAPTGRRILPRP